MYVMYVHRTRMYVSTSVVCTGMCTLKVQINTTSSTFMYPGATVRVAHDILFLTYYFPPFAGEFIRLPLLI